MPCHDPDYSLLPQVLGGKVNHLTRLLCATCSLLEKEGSPILTGDLLEWWKVHKDYDERLAAAKARLREVGWIGDLTPEEKTLIYNEGR